MKRLFKRTVVLLFAFMLASQASFQSGAESQKRVDSPDNREAPSGWKSASPRDEIRPRFSFNSKGGPNGEGSLIISEDERDGLHGWWQKTYPIVGGRSYHFQALRKVKDVAVPRRSAVV